MALMVCVLGESLRARRGTDPTVLLTGQPLRLLSVHLKSFCHQDDLDNVSPDSNSDCGRLKRQIPILEGWIEARAQEGVSPSWCSEISTAA